jgi:hypothetical protein
MIGSILECGLLLTFPFLPMPALKNHFCFGKFFKENVLI